MAKLTAAERKKIPAGQFAGPNRSYPINDANHARNALARASQNASPEEQAEIRSKVHAKYPQIGKDEPEGKGAKAHKMLFGGK
jgi:hypothetical protein